MDGPNPQQTRGRSPIGPPAPARAAFAPCRCGLLIPNLVTLLALVPRPDGDPLRLRRVDRMGGQRDRRARRCWTGSTDESPARSRAPRGSGRSSTRSPISSTSASRRRSCSTSPDLHAMKSLGWLAALVFAIACALRLARFNVMIDVPDQPAWRKEFFVGMPAPAGAIVGLLPVYLRFSFSGGPAGLASCRLEIAYVLARRASDGEPRAAFLRQVDRPGAAGICRGRSDRPRRRRCC